MNDHWNMLALLLAGFALSGTVQGLHVHEQQDVRMFDSDSASLDPAAVALMDVLTRHDFTKEVINSTVEDYDYGLQKAIRVHKSSLFYFKFGDCAEAPRIAEQLNRLIPHLFADEIVEKMKYHSTTTFRRSRAPVCKMGVEVHLNSPTKACEHQRQRRRVAQSALSVGGMCCPNCKKNCNCGRMQQVYVY